MRRWEHAPETETASREVCEIPRDISTQGARRPRVSMTTAHSLETLQKFVSKINSCSPSFVPAISIFSWRVIHTGDHPWVSLRHFGWSLQDSTRGSVSGMRVLAPISSHSQEFMNGIHRRELTTPAHASVTALWLLMIGSISTIRPGQPLSAEGSSLSLSLSLSLSISPVRSLRASHIAALSVTQSLSRSAPCLADTCPSPVRLLP